MEREMARLNVTYGGQNGDMTDMIPYDLDDASIKRQAAEAVQSGSVTGITAQDTDFENFVVDRFPATGDLPCRISLRPKVPFGGFGC